MHTRADSIHKKKDQKGFKIAILSEGDAINTKILNLNLLPGEECINVINVINVIDKMTRLI
jgi:hypothetical protein